MWSLPWRWRWRLLATFGPAVGAARTSTVRALADSARRPRRTRWLIALSTWLPAPLLLGVRLIARRPRRVLLGVAGIAVTVSGIVAVLAGRPTIASDWDGPASLDPQADRANQLFLLVMVMLVALAAVNAIVITWATALDARHASALARALGANPGEVSAGLSAAQVLPALAGAVVGVGGGLALWAMLSNDEANPAWWQLLAVSWEPCSSSRGSPPFPPVSPHGAPWPKRSEPASPDAPRPPGAHREAACGCDASLPCHVPSVDTRGSVEG